MAEERTGAGATNVADSEGMTLFGTIGYSAHLRTDGSVWVSDTEDWSAAELVWRWRRAAPREALRAINVACRRLPQLQSLLPTKPPDVPACPDCGGTGTLTVEGDVVGGVWCPSCCGLGWYVPDDLVGDGGAA